MENNNLEIEKMFFASATYVSKEFGVTKLAICNDKSLEHKFDDRNDGILRCHYDVVISKAVLEAAAKDILPYKFECNGVKYELTGYIARKEERFYNEHRINYITEKKRLGNYSEIKVYSQCCRCTSCYSCYGFDSIKNICGVISLLYEDRTVEIDLQECNHCGSYFIENQSLDIYEKRYGLLKIRKKHITGYEFNDCRYYIYSPTSILSENGYNTTKTSRQERRKILSNMIDSGKYS